MATKKKLVDCDAKTAALEKQVDVILIVIVMMLQGYDGTGQGYGYGNMTRDVC